MRFLTVSLLSIAIFVVAVPSAFGDEEERCIENIPEDFTELERKKAIDECEKEGYTNTQATRESDEIKAAIEVVENCEGYFEHYKRLTESQYLAANTNNEARQCLQLFKVDIWKYEGSDSIEVLGYRLIELENEALKQNKDELERSVEHTKITVNSRILELEDRIESLERMLEQKDMVLMEQVKVILSLTEQLRVFFTSMFEPFYQI